MFFSRYILEGNGREQFFFSLKLFPPLSSFITNDNIIYNDVKKILNKRDLNFYAWIILQRSHLKKILDFRVKYFEKKISSRSKDTIQKSSYFAFLSFAPKYKQSCKKILALKIEKKNIVELRMYSWSKKKNGIPVFIPVI